MSHLFISYARKDIDSVSKIVQALAEKDLNAWIDWESLPKGEDWQQEIYRGIDEADAFLFLISPDSVKSQYCRQEIEHALSSHKRILPIVIRDTAFKDTHLEISKRNWTFCRADQDDFSKALEEICKAIHTDYEWLKYHTELQVKALRWEQKQDASRLLRGKELREAEEQLTRAGIQTDPQPTELQRNYLLASQRNEMHERRKIIIGLGIGFVVVILLAVFAWNQRNNALDSEATAVAEANSRATAESNAIAEANARATAQANAEANAEEAQRQAKIALARQLAVRAQSVVTDKPVTAVLLAIKSMQLFPQIDAAQILQTNPLAKEIICISYNDLGSAAFSPDGKYLVSGGDGFVDIRETTNGKEVAHISSDSSWISINFGPDSRLIVSEEGNTIHVWETASGREIAHMTHDGLINSVVFSPDGNYVSSGGNDKTARVWEVATGKEVSRVVLDGSVNEVTFSPDGKYIMSVSENGVAQIWEPVTGKEIAHIVLGDHMSSATFSPDGSMVVTAHGNSINLWKSSDGTEIAHMEHRSQSNITAVTFSSDSKYVASSGSDYSIHIWEAATGLEISSFYGTFSSSLQFSPDGKYLVIGESSSVHALGTGTGDEVFRIFVGGPVFSLAFSPDGKYLASGIYDGTARIWDAQNGKEVVRITPGGMVRSIAFSSDGEYLITIGDDDTVCIWKTHIKEESLIVHEDYVDLVGFSSDSKYVISKSNDHTVNYWEAATGQNVTRFTYESAGVSDDLSPDGRYLVVEGDYSIHVWDVTSGREIATVDFNDYSMDYLAFSPDGQYFVAGGNDPITYVWETITGKGVALVNYGQVIAFNPDGRYALSSGSDGDYYIWELSSGREISHMSLDVVGYIDVISPDWKYTASAENITRENVNIHIKDFSTGRKVSTITQIKQDEFDFDGLIGFSPDGKYLLSGGKNIVYVWEVTSGSEVARITHDGYFYDTAFSPDGKYFIAGSDDNIARVWEIKTGNEVARMIHKDSVYAVAFSPDGKYVVSGGDNTARAWIWQPEDLLIEACSRVARNLTRSEWEQYIGDALPYQAVCPNLPIEPEVIITPTP